MPPFKVQWLIPLALGQILSLCITGTSVASSALWTHYSVSIPYTQNCLTYIVLFVIHGYRNRQDESYWRQLKQGQGWSFFGFSFADVQANILAVLAFKNTSVLSALVISSWTLPCIMLLSMCCLGYRYYAAHFGGVTLCLIGLFTLIWADTMNNRTTNSNHSWIGDLICLTSATLYAVSNVTEEYLVNRCTTEQFLTRAGMWGSILSGLQALVFEHESLVSIEWRWEIAGLISIYVICLSCMYSLGPTLYRMTNATFLSMSLMTSNFYSLLASLVFLEAQMPPFYPVAYILVICGAAIFNTSDPPSTSHHEQQPMWKQNNGYQCIS
ncbi:hypothetical protein O0I10_002069 [Lichtheimia ornata]|uniref:Solute carrier family 35 member F2 n=1 Tax=Lichtheimia ornata TaxID=688661 RepID=A0AAD7Y172_9FUNG|nr:uncharacterized protein O0I10_002069 [Lichtheimia ornata]KAJ8662375.1 hypothetical protein O0I10_002069 [Lichtheimia ornata]